MRVLLTDCDMIDLVVEEQVFGEAGNGAPAEVLRKDRLATCCPPSRCPTAPIHPRRTR